MQYLFYTYYADNQIIKFNNKTLFIQSSFLINQKLGYLTQAITHF